jgi:hypothetical protein
MSIEAKMWAIFILGMIVGAVLTVLLAIVLVGDDDA